MSKSLFWWVITITLTATLIVLCARPSHSAESTQKIEQERSHAAFNVESLQIKYNEVEKVKQSIKQERSWFNINIIRIIVVKD